MFVCACVCACVCVIVAESQDGMSVGFVLRLDPTPHCDDFIVRFMVQALSLQPPNVMDTVSLFKSTKRDPTAAKVEGAHTVDAGISFVCCARCAACTVSWVLCCVFSCLEL